MNRFASLLLVWLLALAVAPCVQAQSRKALEAKKSKLQKEIAEANKLLGQLSRDKKASIRQIGALNRKIAARNELIRTINTEIGVIDGEIGKTARDIRGLDAEMAELKDGYARMIRMAQRNSNRYERLLFLFAADDFNQALKRLKFMQQINATRRGQAAAIDSTQRLLEVKKAELEARKGEKTDLLAGEMRHKDALDRERKNKDAMLDRLKGQESKVRKDLAQKQKAKKKLEQAIQAIIRREIEAARKAAAAKGKKDVPAKDVFVLTPEARKLSDNFAANKGSLPWPVEKGIISGYFGEHAHPTLKGVKVKNDGIDILTAKGSNARSIFSGEVSGTVDLPGSGAAVIVRHGEYLSVYSNLDKVYVKKGDAISTKQVIGVIGDDEDGKRAEINLQIWKGFTKLNPRQWIAAN